MLCTTVLQNCNYLDVQGHVPQSGAQLSKCSIITQRTDTEETTWYFFFPPNKPSSWKPPTCTKSSFLPLFCYLLMKMKMPNLGFINRNRSQISYWIVRGLPSLVFTARRKGDPLPRSFFVLDELKFLIAAFQEFLFLAFTSDLLWTLWGAFQTWGILEKKYYLIMILSFSQIT